MNGLQPNFLVPVVLFSWPLIVVALFLAMPSRRAVITSVVLAWLFLPNYQYEFIGFPEYNKMTVTSVSLFLATLIFDPNRVLSFRPKWMDAPMAALCLAPMLSSLTNGLGVYDGLSEANNQFMRWGLPYFIGRVYFTDYAGLRELAIGIFIGGLVYLPFCWFEMRMSPQLHRIVYGYHQHAFSQTIRFGGYRPMVFLQHGLMVGMWMTTATLAGLALWQTGGIRTIRGVPMWLFVGALFITTIMCRSSGALVLLVAGIFVFIAVRYLRTMLPIAALAGVCVVYIVLRGSGMWDGHQLVDITNNVFGSDRAESVHTRIYNEEALAAKARQQWLFGWGGWGRSRIQDARGKDISITDSQWVITLGCNGAFGVAALLAATLLPPLLLYRRAPVPWWNHPVAAPAASLAVVVVLWMIDNLMNAMFNPVYVVVIGGIAGLRPLSQFDIGIPARPRAVRQPVPVPRRRRIGAAQRP